MMKVLLPKTFVPIDEKYGPLFFLAGPVRGGGDWQVECCAEISRHIENFYVAVPYYHDRPNPLSHLKTPGNEKVFLKPQRQRHWERHYLIEAAKHGCIIFWLPKEDPTDMRPREDGPYGQDTYGELGRYAVEQKYNRNYKISLGGEEGFHGLELIHGNYQLDIGYEVPLERTLADTVMHAVTLAILDRPR